MRDGSLGVLFFIIIMEKKFHLYVLYDTNKHKPIYIGITSNLKQRVKKHLKSKSFDGVWIVESFNDKKDCLIAERTLIKYLSVFIQDDLLNGLYLRYNTFFMYPNLINSFNKILNTI